MEGHRYKHYLIETLGIERGEEKFEELLSLKQRYSIDEEQFEDVSFLNGIIRAEAVENKSVETFIKDANKFKIEAGILLVLTFISSLSFSFFSLFLITRLPDTNQVFFIIWLLTNFSYTILLIFLSEYFSKKKIKSAVK